MAKPTRCIDPVVKCCQYCGYGYTIYPEGCETYDDIYNCTFESGCIYGLENTEPTQEEINEFEKRMKGLANNG